MPNSPTGKIEADASRDVLESLASSDCMLTAKQLGKMLAMSPKTLYSYVSRDLIPYYKIESNVPFRGMTSRSGFAGAPPDIALRSFGALRHSRECGYAFKGFCL